MTSDTETMGKKRSGIIHEIPFVILALNWENHYIKIGDISPNSANIIGETVP